jgi:hypothetical protein
MKFLLCLSMFALMMPAFARAESGDGDESSMSLPERITLLKKIVQYNGKVTGSKSGVVRSQVKALLKNKDQIADLVFNCDKLNPTMDDGQKIHILSCQTSFIIPDTDGNLAVMEFGANGWEVDTAKVTDIDYKTCDKRNQETRDGVLACREKRPMPPGMPIPRGVPIPPGMPAPVGLPKRNDDGPPPEAVGMPMQKEAPPEALGMPAPRKGPPPGALGMPAPRKGSGHPVLGMPSRRHDQESEQDSN